MKHGAALVVVVLGVGLVGAGTVLAAGPDFLKIDGIVGASAGVGHSGEIEVLSFSFGVSRHPAATMGGARAAAVPISDLTITKRMDASSPKLMNACATSKHIPRVTLETRAMKYELHDVVISSVRNGGANETVVLNYATMQQLPVITAPRPVGAASRAPSKVLIKRP